jgi:hypothetical protein
VTMSGAGGSAATGAVTRAIATATPVPPKRILRGYRASDASA